MFGLGVAKPAGSSIARLGQQRWPAIGPMCIGRDHRDQSFIEHALGPVLRAPPESPGDGASGQLHPGTSAGHALKYGIV